MKELSTQTQKELISYMSQFVTNRRHELILKTLKERTRYITVVLENLYQSHNASAVMRSCECFGVQDVYAIESEHEFEPNSEIVMGSFKWLTLNRYKSTKECLTKVKEKGYSLVATSLREDTIPISELKVDKPIALIYGTEEEGLSDEVYEYVDQSIKIPMYGFTQSFNVSVSVALSLYELVNKLKKTDIKWGLSDEEKLALELDWMIKSAQNGEKIINKYLADKDIIPSPLVGEG